MEEINVNLNIFESIKFVFHFRWVKCLLCSEPKYSSGENWGSSPCCTCKKYLSSKSLYIVWVDLKRTRQKKLRAAKIFLWRFFYSVEGLPCPRDCLKLGLRQNRKSRASDETGMDKDCQSLALKLFLQAKGNTAHIQS